MKLLRNICLIVLVLGIVLCVGGAAAGGTLYSSWWNGTVHTWREALEAGRNYVYREWHDDDHHDWFDPDDDDWFDPDDGRAAAQPDASASSAGSAAASVSTGVADDFTQGLTAYTFTNDELRLIRSLDVDIEHGDLLLDTGDTLALATEGASIRIEEYTLKIDPARGAAQTRVHLTIPAQAEYDEVDLQCKGGLIALGAVSCREFDLETWGAAVTLDSLSATETSFSIGAGTLTAGRITSRETDLSCGAGTAEVGFSGAQSDYTIEAECGAGTLRLDGKDALTGPARETTFGRGYNKIEAEIGAGTIALTFAD